MEHSKSRAYSHIDKSEKQRQVHANAAASEAIRPQPEFKWRSKLAARRLKATVFHRLRFKPHPKPELVWLGECKPNQPKPKFGGHDAEPGELDAPVTHSESNRWSTAADARGKQRQQLRRATVHGILEWHWKAAVHKLQKHQNDISTATSEPTIQAIKESAVWPIRKLVWQQDEPQHKCFRQRIKEIRSKWKWKYKCPTHEYGTQWSNELADCC